MDTETEQKQHHHSAAVDALVLGLVWIPTVPLTAVVVEPQHGSVHANAQLHVVHTHRHQNNSASSSFLQHSIERTVHFVVASSIFLALDLRYCIFGDKNRSTTGITHTTAASHVSNTADKRVHS